MLYIVFYNLLFHEESDHFKVVYTSLSYGCIRTLSDLGFRIFCPILMDIIFGPKQTKEHELGWVSPYDLHHELEILAQSMSHLKKKLVTLNDKKNVLKL